ncbi:MAG: DUF1847 domain-containing protein [Desulfobacteraceae bacterium]|nr:DUF1847 domain-containing protein [Desulfobacteraceae bacterium]
MTAKKRLTQCAYCKGNTCDPSTGINEPMPPIDKAPPTCPMRKYEEVIRQGNTHYHKKNIQEFARLASVQEAQCYETEGGEIKTRIPRIEEIMQFADKCGYTMLGLAFCLGLRAEAKKITRIFESNGFDVASVCCKVGRTPKESIGITGEHKIRGSEAMEPMCNPIVQAELLNTQNVDLAILLGLCVGHDTLFIKYCNVPCTVLAVKDRVTGHNPLAAIYLSESPYYGRLQKTEKPQKPKTEWKKVDITVEK